MYRMMLAAAVLPLVVGAAPAQVVILHSFAGGPADGQSPMGSLMQSGSNFYGLTQSGGGADFGVIYKIGTDGSGYGVIHTFTGIANDGRSPSGSLTPYLSRLYGLTQGGGGTDNGVVFGIGADGSGFGVVHPFAGSPSDGSIPQGSLALSGSTFYGTTGFGGSAGGGGTIFKVNADSTGYTVLHSFAGGPSDGRDPVGGAPAVSGTMLFGMTAAGGSTGNGVVYRIGTDGTGFTVLHSFTFDPSDGNTPFGSVIVNGTTLYGMTTGGGVFGDNGTIFKIGTDGSGFTLLHSFAGGPADGRDPLGELLLSGSSLFGTTYRGGSADLGTLFDIGIDGTGYNVIHSFLGGPGDGANPAADLILNGSTFYGTTVIGGASNNGTIFSFTPVPEPGTMALVSAAAAGATWVIRRKRRIPLP